MCVALLEGVCVGGGALESLLRSDAGISRKQKKSFAPICGCFRCTFSLHNSRDARRRAAVIGPHFHINSQVTGQQSCHGDGPQPVKADSWNQPTLRAGLDLRRGKLMKYLVLLHVKHTGGFWPNYWRWSVVQGMISAPVSLSRSFICCSKWVHPIFILISHSQDSPVTSAKC